MAEQPGEYTSGWARTLSRTSDLAAELRTAGWEVVTVRAGHVAPVTPEQVQAERFGLVYLAPGNVAEAFSEAVSGSFDRYEVLSNQEGSIQYLLTCVYSSAQDVVVLIAGAVDTTVMDGLARVARERGAMYSHVELLDGTHLGSIHHDDPEPFLPEWS